MGVVSMRRVGIIGCGVMGSAIARTLHDKGVVYDVDPERARALAKGTKFNVVETLESAVKESDLLLLAVKPQTLPSIYPALVQAGSKDKRWISIAAGVSTLTLAENLGTTEIVRFMPNIAARYGYSVTAVAAHREARAELLEEAKRIALGFGHVHVLDERLFDGFTAISGSAVAFIIKFLDSLAQGGTDEGIAYPLSLTIATQTAESAVTLIKESGLQPQDLISRVSSAGGTTVEGIKALIDGNLQATVGDAVKKTAQRSRELEKEAANHTKRK